MNTHLEHLLSLLLGCASGHRRAWVLDRGRCLDRRHDVIVVMNEGLSALNTPTKIPLNASSGYGQSMSRTIDSVTMSGSAGSRGARQALRYVKKNSAMKGTSAENER